MSQLSFVYTANPDTLFMSDAFANAIGKQVNVRVSDETYPMYLREARVHEDGRSVMFILTDDPNEEFIR